MNAMEKPCVKCGKVERSEKSGRCIPCKKVISEKYYNKNKDLISASHKKWRLENPEKSAEYAARWKARNPEAVRLINSARRRGGGGRPSRGIVRRLFDLQRGKCACCGSLLTSFHVDHIMPLALGGSNDDKNLQLLLPSCNLKKSAKHPIDYMQSKGNLL